MVTMTFPSAGPAATLLDMLGPFAVLALVPVGVVFGVLIAGLLGAQRRASRTSPRTGRAVTPSARLRPAA